MKRRCAQRDRTPVAYGSPSWVRWLRLVAVTALLLGMMRSIQTHRHEVRGAVVSWDDILGGYAKGAEIARGFAVVEIGRGHEDDVALRIARTGAPEERFFVHIVPRGRWTGIRESQSFGIAYEVTGAVATTEDMDAVTEVLAGVVRRADNGFASVSAIPLHAEPDATAMPWWTDVLRGATGGSIGLSLVGIAAILVAPGVVTSLAGLIIAWIGRGEFSEKLQSAIPGALPILFAGAIALLVADLSRRRERGHSIMWCIGALGLALRLGLGAFGPFRIHGVAPIWIRAAAGHPEAVAAYGPGYPELFGPAARMFPGAPDFAVFASNAVLSASIPIAAFALSRLAGGGIFHASIAALMLALDPVSIRCAATEAYFVPIAALLAWSMVGVALAHEHALSRRGHASLGAMIASAWLVAAGARIHPVAFPPLLLVPMAALTLRIRHTGRFPSAFVRAGHLLALGLAMVGAAVATSAGPVLDAIHHMKAGALLQSLAPGTVPAARWTVAGVLVPAVAGALLLLRPRTRHLVVPATVVLGVMLALMHVYNQGALWQESFCRLYLTLPVVAVAMLIPVPPPGARFVVVLGALLASSIWVDRALPVIRARTTEHLEYRWIRSWMAALPADCRTVHVAFSAHSNLFLPTYMASARPPSSFIELRPSDPHTLSPALPPKGCMYYIHTTLCSAQGARTECEEVERRFRLVQVSNATFPAAPSSDHIVYEGNVVESAIYRIEQR